MITAVRVLPLRAACYPGLNWRPWCVSTFLVGRASFELGTALCVGKGEACPHHDQNAAEEVQGYFCIL